VTLNGEFGANMAIALGSLESRSRFRSNSPKPRETELHASDRVIVRLPKGEALGTIIAIEEQMNAAYLSYDGYPPVYDEYQPYSKIRISVGGETVEIKPADVKRGAKVLNRWGETGEVSLSSKTSLHAFDPLTDFICIPGVQGCCRAHLLCSIFLSSTSASTIVLL
jgi:hypothetical protein